MNKKEVNVFNKSGIGINDFAIKKIIVFIWKKFFPYIKSGYANFVLTDDSEIKKLNRKYLKRNRTTDVISFYYHDQKDGNKSTNNSAKHIEGDVFISIPQAIRQSELFGKSLSSEIMLLCIHGFLHLIGYRDYNEAEKEEMRFMENKLISKIKSTELLTEYHGYYSGDF